MFGYIGNLFKNNWVKYVFYSVLLILVHNFIVWKCLDVSATYINFRETIENIILSFLFVSRERFAGAMWFVLPNIFSCAFLAGFVTLSDRISRTGIFPQKRILAKNILLTIFVILSALLTYGMKLMFNIQLSFVVLPICLVAYFLNKFKTYIENKIKIADGCQHISN